MQTLWYALLAVLTGAIIAIYLPMNSAVSQGLGSPVAANVTFYGVGLLASVLLLAGQVAMAVAVSHLGILGSPQDPITWQKLAGAPLLIAGAVVSIA